MALRTTVARLFGRIAAEVEGAPPAEFTFAPSTAEDAAAVLEFASDHRMTVVPWGGGTHQMGPPALPDVVLATSGFGGIDWRPDDLTAVVGAGIPLTVLEERLAGRGQSAMLPENPGRATVGGVIAAGASAWRRLRYGPTRDRVLEVVVATGDGRVIRGGGQVVKNVSGYDLPRLFTGSLGSLGVITRVCLKLWPAGATTATVATQDATRALAVAHRPLAVLESTAGVAVYLAGTPAEVEAQARNLGDVAEQELVWPERPIGAVAVSLRIPPADVAAAVALVRSFTFVAAHGVGEVLVAGDIGLDTLHAWREWAESRGGALIVTRAPADHAFDVWGTPPATVELQRRVKAAFDPLSVMVPGRLPGGL